MTGSRERIARFLTDHAPDTPCLVLDIDLVAARAGELAREFPGARLCYAVKANPEPAVLRAVLAAGACFDVASRPEIELCLACGADPADLSYGNPIKKPADIAFAHRAGVRDFVTDSAGDLRALAELAPGASVSVRLLTETPDSVTPFGQKFGCAAPVARALLREAAALGLDPAGLSFHVGSQQPDPAAWETGIAAAATVYRELAGDGIRPSRLNIGGGFAVGYTTPAPDLAGYARAVHEALRRHFPGGAPALTLEPGRVLVAEAGVIRTQVVLVSHRPGTGDRRWVYLDIGRYNGLAETENEAIAYRFEPVGPGQNGPVQEGTAQDGAGGSEEQGPVIIAGPTCDGDDVLYQHTPYRLPLRLRAGDLIDIPATGAYTASYSSVAFNGIPPLRTYCLSEGRLLGA